MGNELNLLCDLTIAGESARFGQAGPVGSVPAAGGTQLLSIVCGLKRAKEIMFLCRTYWRRRSRDGAGQRGRARTTRLDDEVRRWCDELLALSPQSLRDRQAVAVHRARPAVVVGPARGRAGPLVHPLGRHRRGAAAFLEKRPADFRAAAACLEGGIVSRIDLAGRTALVTGAGQGRGPGDRRGLRAAGADVWVNDLEAERPSRRWRR